MNNHGLLAGLLSAVLLGGGVCGNAQSTVSLEEIFECAESHSARLRGAFSAEKEAEEGVRTARSGRLPQIDASLSLSYIGDGFITRRNFSGREKAPIPHFGNGFSINVTQPVYTGGALSGGIELAELKKKASGHAVDCERDNIRLQLTNFYLDLYRYTNLRHVAEGNISAAEKVLAEMKARHQQGTVLQNDITRYELFLSDLELELVRIDNSLAILNSNLVTLAGLPDGFVVLPDTLILERFLPSAGLDWWLREAKVNSPVLRLACSNVDISRKAEKIVKAERLPKIGLKAAWTIDGPILVEVPPVNRNLGYWYVGVGVTYDISSLYKGNRSLARSRAATLHSLDELAVADENISLEVRTDYIRYMEAYEELKTRDKGEELAERNYKTVSTRYSAGMALITDMLDAANARLDAQERLVNARINIIDRYYKLLFTAGKI